MLFSLWSCGTALCMSLAPLQTESDAPIVIHPLGGDLVVWRGKGKKTEPLKARSTLSPLDRTGAPKGTPARFSVDGKIHVSLVGVTAGPSDGLSVSRSKDTIRLRLYKGRLLVESLDSDVSVTTDQGTARGKAAYFLVEAVGKTTRIVAFDGQLKVSNDLGGIVLEPGRTGELDGRKAPRSRPTTARDLQGAGRLENPGNLLTNPGFEQGLDGWFVTRTPARKLSKIDEAKPRSGRRCVRLDLSGVKLAAEARPVNEDSAPGIEGGSALIKVQPKCLEDGQRYLFKIWFRTEGLMRKSEPVPFTVFRSHDLRGPESGTLLRCPPSGGRWRAARFVFTADGPDLLIFLQQEQEEGTYQGTVWVDDVYLARLPPASDE